jgi:hypothetical protein
MNIIQIRKIIGSVGYSVGCMRDYCTNTEQYVLIPQDGPKKGIMYFVCEDCLEELRSKHDLIPIPLN